MSEHEMPAAPGSPLERARRRLREVQQEDFLHLDVPRWGDDLVMRIGIPDDAGGSASIRALASFAAGVSKATVDELADALASAVVGLYAREPGSRTATNPDGNLSPILVEATGRQLRFDGEFGAAIGVPECTTPRGAVMVAYTHGEPPALNTGMLEATVMAVGMWLSGETARAEQSVSGS